MFCGSSSQRVGWSQCVIVVFPDQIYITYSHTMEALVISIFYFERDFMLSLSDNFQTNVIEAFASTLRYYLLNINNPYFEQMVRQISTTNFS